jgi:hypothetical protein
MREIEFRAWLKRYKEIAKVDLLGKNKILSGRCWFDFKDIELMQYTGIKDKNGVKIFEGDIVKVYGRTFDNALKYNISKVIYLDSQFALYIYNQYFAIYSDLCSNYEVIGNIYENKELLEAKNECRN